MKKRDIDEASRPLAAALTPKPKTIQWIELVGFLAAEERYRQAALAVKTLKAERDTLEGDLVKRLQAGVRVRGPLVAVVVAEPGDCRPPWKEEYLHHMEEAHGVQGTAAEQKVRERHPAGTHDRLAVGVRPK